jgi:hypothetical protein
MATLTPTLTLASSDMNGDVLNLSVTDTLTVLGQVTTKQVVATSAGVVFATAANYSKSYVYIKNLSTVAAEIITIEAPSVISADLTDDATVTVASTRKLSRGMTVSSGSVNGVTAGQTIASITSATEFELSAIAAPDGSGATMDLTYNTDEYMKLGPGEFAFFPWIATDATTTDQDASLACSTASGSPVLEVRIYQEAAA